MNETLTASFNVADAPFSRGIGRIVGYLDNLMARSEQVNQRLKSSFAGATNSVNQFADANNRLREANGRFASMGDSSAGSLLKLSAGFFAADKALDLLKEGLKITSDFQRLDAGLSNVSSSSVDFARSQSFVRSLSDQLGLSVTDLSASFRGLKAATNGTNLQGVQTEKIFAAVVRAGAALKLSNDEVKGSLLAISQMVSKGVVSMEELRQQLGERLPGAFGLAAKAMGVSQSELNKMVSSGQVLSTDLLPKLAAQLEAVYGEKAQSNAETMAGGWQRLTNQASLFIAEFSKTSGIDAFFANLAAGIANATIGLREMGKQGLNGGLGGALFNNNRSRIAQNAGRMREEFPSLNPGQQQARLEMLQEQIKNTKDLTQQVILIPLLNDLKKINQAVKREERNKSDVTIAAKPAFDLDTAKKRLDTLKDLIANGLGNHQDVSKLQKEFNKLDAEIERVTATTKKQKAVHDSNAVGLTTNELILKRITRELEQQGKLAPQSLRERVGLFQQLVKEEKELANNKPVDIGYRREKIKQAPLADRLRDGLLGQVAPLQRLQGLLDRASEPGRYRGLEFFQEQIEKIRLQADRLSLKNLSLPKDALDTLKEYVQQLAKADIARRKTENIVQGEVRKVEENEAKTKPGFDVNMGGGNSIRVFNNMADSLERRIQKLNDDITSGLQQAANSALEGMGNIIGNMMAGVGDLSQIPQLLGNVFASLGKSMGEAMIAFGTAGIAAKAFVTNPISAIAAGVALIALSAGLQATMAKQANASFSKAPGYEMGGLFRGEKTIRVAETAKARRGGGELVTSVESGTNLIGDRIAERMKEMSAISGPQRVSDFSPSRDRRGELATANNLNGKQQPIIIDVGGTLTTKISANDLLFILERAQRAKKERGNG